VRDSREYRSWRGRNIQRRGYPECFPEANLFNKMQEFVHRGQAEMIRPVEKMCKQAFAQWQQLDVTCLMGSAWDNPLRTLVAFNMGRGEGECRTRTEIDLQK
jgi:hypothetical protein